MTAIIWGIMGPHKDAPHVSDLSEAQQQQVTSVLETLLRSSQFASAHRGQRFLRYVVEQALNENRDGLKERTIGVEVFERDPDYSTGDDAVVRVQAGDVRKRLERFFAQPEAGDLPVEILLPTGTYCPEFVFREGATQVAVLDSARPTARKRFFAFAVLGLLVIATLGWWMTHRQGTSAFQEFWSPLTRARQPVLLCVAKATPYYPSRQFLMEHGATRSGEFHTQWQRMGKPFTMAPDEQLRWGDLEEMQEFGVATGDVYSAVQLSLAFARMNKDSQLRVGSGYQFEDLRNSPSVLVGAFNNRWTMLIGAGLPYRFLEDSTGIGIEEVGGARRVWRVSTIESRRQQDYAIVARLLNTDTGQPVIILGGIGASGTQAATEFVTNSSHLGKALGQLSKDWRERNVEFLISTTVTDGVAGPPTVVTSVVW